MDTKEKHTDLFSSIVENNPDGIIICDKSGKILYANQRAENIFSIFPLQGTYVDFPIEDRTIIEQDFNIAGNNVSHEIRINENSWQNNTAFLLQIRPISDIKQKFELSKIEQHYRSAIENNEILIYSYNFKKQAYDYLTPTSDNFMGHSLEEFSNKTFEESMALFHPEEQQEIQEAIDDFVQARKEKSKNFNFICRFKNAEDDYEWISDWVTVFLDNEYNLESIVGISYNIDEQKKNEEKARTIENRFNMLMDATGNGYMEINLIKKSIIFSKNWDKILGLTADGRISMSRFIEEFIDEKYRSYFLEEIDKHIFDITHKLDIEIPIKTTLKNYKICRIKGRKMTHDEIGQAANIICSISDVSNERNILDKYIEDSTKLKTLVDQSIDGLIFIDNNGLIVGWNKSMERITGLLAVDVLGRAAWEVQGFLTGRNVTDDDEDFYKIALLEFLRIGKADFAGKTMDAEFIRPDGIPVFIEHAVYPIEVGDKFFAVEVIHDNTAEKILDKEISNLDEKYEAILSNSEDVLYRHNIANEEIDYVSPSIEKLLGYKPEEFLDIFNNRQFEIVHPEEIPHIASFMDKIRYQQVEETNFNIEFKLKAKNGRFKVVCNNVKLIKDDNNNVIYTIGNIRERTTENTTKNYWKEKEYYQLLKENTNDLIFKLDSENRYTFVTETFCNLFDKTEKELIGSTFTPLIHEDDRRKTQEQLNQLYRMPYKCEFEHRVQTPIGWRWLSWLYKTEVDEKGNVTALIAVGQDITIQKRKEESFHNEKYLNEQIFDTLNSIAVLLDIHGNIIKFNKYMEELSGYKLEEVHGKPWIDIFVPEEDRDYIRTIFAKTLENAHNVGFINTIVTKNNKRVTVEWYDRTLKNQYGQTVSLIAIGYNITSKESYKKQLRQSELKFKASFDFAGIGMALLNPEGTFIQVNNSLSDILGYRHADLENIKFNDIVGSYFKGMTSELFKRLLLGSEVYDSIEMKLVNRNNEELWVQVNFSTVKDEKNNILMFIIQMQDIDDRKRAEEDLKEMIEELQYSKKIIEDYSYKLLDVNMKLEQSEQELIEINNTKDRFFSIIAHDLKSPFQGFIGLTKLLSSNIKKLKKDEIADLAKTMNHTAQNIYRLLENLLHWSRIQRNSIKINPEEIILCDLIDMVVDVLDVNIIHKKLKMKIKCDKNIKVYVDLNSANLILRNVLSNAIKYSDFHGDIEINVERIDEYYCVSVKDNGLGMDNEQLANLFQINKHSSTPGTANEPGSGLGLIITKEMIESNAGKINVESNTETGTTVNLSFPAT